MQMNTFMRNTLSNGAATVTLVLPLRRSADTDRLAFPAKRLPSDQTTLTGLFRDLRRTRRCENCVWLVLALSTLGALVLGLAV
jgi:hypothetical protein